MALSQELMGKVQQDKAAANSRVAGKPRASRSFKASGKSFSKSPEQLADPRRVQVIVQRIDPWSAAKITFPLAIVIGLVLTVAIVILWGVMQFTGVIGSVTNWISGAGFNASSLDLTSILGIGNIFFFMILFTVILSVSMTLLSVAFAFIYNALAKLVGGLHLTLGDD